MQEYREFLENIIKLAEQANCIYSEIEITEREDSIWAVDLKNTNHNSLIAQRLTHYDAEYFAAVSPRTMKKFCEKMIKILDSVE